MPDFYDQARYDLELRELIESIFSGISIPDAADDDMYLLFTRPDWRVVGLPIRILSAPTVASFEPVEPVEAEFHDAWIPLFDMLRLNGENDLIIAARPADTIRPVEPAVAAACKFDRREINEAMRTCGFLVYDEYLVFGRTQVWGLATHWENITILGGTAEFIGSYVSAAGGIDAVRRRFENSIDYQLRSKSGESNLDRFADRIVRSIRWPA